MQTPTEEKKQRKENQTEDGGRLIVDPEQIRALVELMSEHQLTEILLKAGDDEIRLARQAATTSVDNGQAVVSAQPVASPPAGSAASAPPPAPASVEPGVDETLLPVVSPMVGTFYASRDPQSPPFVNVGSRVDKNTVVGIVEAMKVFNEITAGLSGTIVEVLVRNEEPVEYGHSLFMVKPD